MWSEKMSVSTGFCIDVISFSAVVVVVIAHIRMSYKCLVHSWSKAMKGGRAVRQKYIYISVSLSGKTGGRLCRGWEEGQAGEEGFIRKRHQ